MANKKAIVSFFPFLLVTINYFLHIFATNITNDDETVTNVNILKAMKTKISEDESKKITPYILIYHYIN